MLEIKPISVKKLIDHNLTVRHRTAHDILDRFKNSLVVRALRLNGRQMRPTADMLGVSVDILKRWMREAGIDRFQVSDAD